MRWITPKKTYPPTPEHGMKRIVKKFLFFPVTIDTDTRWFEFASFEEEFLWGWSFLYDKLSPVYGSWEKVRWIDEKDTVC